MGLCVLRGQLHRNQRLRTHLPVHGDFSLTRDETATPDALADYAMRHNYYVQGKGTLWSFLTDAGSKYSVQGTETPLDEIP